MANEQRQEALWRVFLMFVVIALIIVRAGLVARGAVAALPPEEERRDAGPRTGGQPSSALPADLYRAVLVVLSLAEAVGRLFILKARACWELMNQPLPRPARERRPDIAGLGEGPALRLDTS